MSELRDVSAAIGQTDIRDAAVIFAATKATFSAREFTEFLHIQAVQLHEEPVNEILLDMAERGQLREIGPAVYAKPSCGTPLEHPLWPEEAGG